MKTIPMEFLEGRTLSKHLLEKYSKNPAGWSFTMFPSSKEDSRFFGALVSGPDETWQLKIDSIFKPNPMMLGTKVEVDPSRVKPLGPVPYGYRKIDRSLIRQLVKALEEEAREDGRRMDLGRILGPIDPVVPKSGEAYAEGPIVLTGRESAGISDVQKQLEDRLSSELRKLMRNRYQSYG